MKLLKTFMVSFECDGSKTEVYNKIKNTNFEITNYKYISGELSYGSTVDLLPEPDSLLYHNSFIPDVKIYLDGISDKTIVKISFSHTKETKFFLKLVVPFMVVLTECVIYGILYEQNKLLNYEMLFFILPIILAGMFYIVAHMSLKSTIGAITDRVTEILNVDIKQVSKLKG